MKNLYPPSPHSQRGAVQGPIRVICGSGVSEEDCRKINALIHHFASRLSERVVNIRDGVVTLWVGNARGGCGGGCIMYNPSAGEKELFNVLATAVMYILADGARAPCKLWVIDGAATRITIEVLEELGARNLLASLPPRGGLDAEELEKRFGRVLVKGPGRFEPEGGFNPLAVAKLVKALREYLGNTGYRLDAAKAVEDLGGPLRVVKELCGAMHGG